MVAGNKKRLCMLKEYDVICLCRWIYQMVVKDELIDNPQAQIKLSNPAVDPPFGCSPFR